MTDILFIQPYNETNVIVTGSNEGIERELSDSFSFYVPNYRFMPAYKSGMWSGKIRLYNQKTNTIYKGLIERIRQWAAKRSYQVIESDQLQPLGQLSITDAENFYNSLNLPDQFEKRDYQIESFADAISNDRRTIVSPTGSGKSLIIYLICRYLNIKTLIIVPTVNLIHQMAGDFKDYNYEEPIHEIYSGKDRETNSQITASTWQSIHRLKKEWFNQFELVIVDEVHHATAKSLTNILEKMTTVKYRYGTTGTLDGTETNQLVIEGLFGSVHQVTTTAKLIEEKTLAKLTIKPIVIKYPEKLRQEINGIPYQQEVNDLVTNKERSQLIVDLVTRIPGNNLVMVNLINKHGDPLHELFVQSTDRPVFYIKGAVNARLRDEIRKTIETHDNAIIIASTKAFATGSNVKKLNNIFFTSPSKSRIKVLQSIGRVLRKTETKHEAALYDIVDDVSIQTKTGKSKYSYSMIHFFARLKMYKEEKYQFKVRYVNLPKPKEEING